MGEALRKSGRSAIRCEDRDLGELMTALSDLDWAVEKWMEICKVVRVGVDLFLINV